MGKTACQPRLPLGSAVALTLLLAVAAMGGLEGTPLRALGGTVHMSHEPANLAVRRVVWTDNLGKSGVAQLQWNVLSGNYTAGYEDETRWSIPRSSGRSSVNR